MKCSNLLIHKICLAIACLIGHSVLANDADIQDVVTNVLQTIHSINSGNKIKQWALVEKNFSFHGWKSLQQQFTASKIDQLTQQHQLQHHSIIDQNIQITPHLSSAGQTEWIVVAPLKLIMQNADIHIEKALKAKIHLQQHQGQYRIVHFQEYEHSPSKMSIKSQRKSRSCTLKLK